MQRVQPFWVQNEKNNTIFTVSKIEAMRKLNNPTATSFAELCLTIVNDGIVIKTQKPFTLSLSL